MHIPKLLQHLDQKTLLFAWQSLVKISLKYYFIRFIGSCWYNVKMPFLFLPSLSLLWHATVFPGAEGWQYEQIIMVNHCLVLSNPRHSKHITVITHFLSFSKQIIMVHQFHISECTVVLGSQIGMFLGQQGKQKNSEKNIFSQQWLIDHNSYCNS